MVIHKVRKCRLLHLHPLFEANTDVFLPTLQQQLLNMSLSLTLHLTLCLSFSIAACDKPGCIASVLPHSQPVDPDDPDTTIPVIGVIDKRQAAIITANDVVREASSKAVQVNSHSII